MSGVATDCFRTFEAAQYDKPRAAVEQLENAIVCFFKREWPSSVTLALAAEGMLPLIDDKKDLFQFSKEFLKACGHSEKQSIAYVNRQRDWLKHDRQEKVMEFTQHETANSVLRALVRIQLATGQVSNSTPEFENWVRTHLVTEIDRNSPISSIEHQSERLS